jgi:hypothetical protein
MQPCLRNVGNMQAIDGRSDTLPTANVKDNIGDCDNKNCAHNVKDTFDLSGTDSCSGGQ